MNPPLSGSPDSFPRHRPSASRTPTARRPWCARACSRRAVPPPRVAQAGRACCNRSRPRACCSRSSRCWATGACTRRAPSARRCCSPHTRSRRDGLERERRAYRQARRGRLGARRAVPKASAPRSSGSASRRPYRREHRCPRGRLPATRRRPPRLCSRSRVRRDRRPLQAGDRVTVLATFGAGSGQASSRPIARDLEVLSVGERPANRTRAPRQSRSVSRSATPRRPLRSRWRTRTPSSTSCSKGPARSTAAIPSATQGSPP